MGGLVLFLLCLIGCVDELDAIGIVNATDSDNTSPVSANTSLVSSANTSFGFQLLAEIHKQDANKNIFVSPLSVSIALAMTLNGAVGETQQAMAKTLELDGMSLDAINSAYSELQKSLQNLDPKVELAIANSLWARQGVDFKPDFLQRNRQFYGAEITSLDFDSLKTPEIINQWVDKNTNGKIRKIVEQINRQTVMLLINAIYFKGKWKKAFDKSKTTDLIFHLPDGREKQTPMMFQSDKYLYYRGDNFQAVSLPYGEGRLSMDIFLPAPDSNLNEFLTSLNTENWESWISQFRKMDGDIMLPRFKLEYEITLNNALKAMGMAIAFDPNRANFRDMRPVPPNLFINQIKHKTFVEVNEEGTEAAAATSVEIRATSAALKFTFVVDRPFFFAIQDSWTETVLFMGTVINPI